MSIRTRRKPMRAVAVATAAALGASLLAISGPGSVGAAPTVTTTRVEGANRYLTAIEVSKATFPISGTTSYAIIASGESSVDGLAAAALAGRRNAPVLLIPASGVVSTELNAEITRLGATNIVIVGGTSAVAAAAETNLAATGRTITRISGENRYETAAKVATDGVAAANVGNFPGTTSRAVIIARGDNPADALIASGVAYAGRHPILLTRTGSLDSFTSAAITALGATRAVIMGGTGAISDAAKAEIEALGVTTVRVGGADRAATATAFADVATTSFGFSAAVPMLVTGTDFADALVASSHSGKLVRPILYASTPGQTGLPSATATWLATNANSITALLVIGGTAAVPAAVVDAAKAEAQKVSIAVLEPVSATITQVPATANANVGLLEVTFRGGAIAAGTPNSTKFTLVKYDGGRQALEADKAFRVSDTVVRLQFGVTELATFAAATSLEVDTLAVQTAAAGTNIKKVLPLKSVTNSDINGLRLTAVSDVAAVSGNATFSSITLTFNGTVSTSVNPAVAGAVTTGAIWLDLGGAAGTRVTAGANPTPGVQATASASTVVVSFPTATLSAISGLARVTVTEETIRGLGNTDASLNTPAADFRPQTLLVGSPTNNLNAAGRPTATGVSISRIAPSAASGANSTIVTVTFDRTVVGVDQAKVSVQSIGAGAVASTSGVALITTGVSSGVTAATFTVNGIDPKEIVRVTLADGAATAVGSKTSAPQSLTVAQTFAAGDVLGPNLTAVSGLTVRTDPLTGAVAGYRMTLTFSQAVRLNGGTSPTGSPVTLKTIRVNGTPGTDVTATVVTPTAASGYTTSVVVEVGASAVPTINEAALIGIDGGVQNLSGKTGYYNLVTRS